MEILFHDDNPMVHERSSVDQFKDSLSVYRGGTRYPIEFDQIDYIECDRIVSHPIIVDDDEIGFYFPDAFCGGLRVGQHYYLADEILPADDIE